MKQHLADWQYGPVAGACEKAKGPLTAGPQSAGLTGDQ